MALREARVSLAWISRVSGCPTHSRHDTNQRMLKASLERMVALQALILTELLNPVADFAATGGG